MLRPVAEAWLGMILTPKNNKSISGWGMKLAGAHAQEIHSMNIRAGGGGGYR